jgi:predicted deacetylase
VLDGDAVMSVTLHDVAPATQARCEALISRLERLGSMPMTLLVVPNYHGQRSNPRFERWLDARVARGDELALHGLTHRDDGPAPRGLVERVRRRWYTDAEGEFAAIELGEAARRIESGRRWFARRGWPLHGFVAPAWLLGDQAWLALERQPLEYTCTRTALVTLPGRHARRPQTPLKALDGWSIVYSTRAAWRRALSVPYNRWLAGREQQQKWMRFELHPNDVEHRGVRESALGLVRDALHGHREALTLAALAERLR